MKKRIFGLGCILLLLAGCVSNEYTAPEYERTVEHKFPPLTLFSMTPEGEFAERCRTYDDKSPLHHCQLNSIDFREVYQELVDSEMFESVHLANGDVPYQLLLSSAVYNLEGAKELGSAAIAGATLMLAPIRVSVNIHIDAVLAWHGQPLKRYHYEIPFTYNTNLFSMSQNSYRDQAKAIVSRLIADIQKDDVLSPEYLYATLRASDYKGQLKLPDSLGDYLSNPLILYPHPLFGVQARYIHRQFQFDYVDVFIYPIPSWEWEDLEQVQARESLRIRKEMEFVEKQGHWKNLELGPDVQELWRVNDAKLPILKFSGTFLAEDNERYQTHTYLFAKKDKFVKVRASFSGEGRDREEVEAFVHGLAAGVEVPDESLFMAELRNRWRSSGSL